MVHLEVTLCNVLDYVLQKSYQFIILSDGAKQIEGGCGAINEEKFGCLVTKTMIFILHWISQLRLWIGQTKMNIAIASILVRIFCQPVGAIAEKNSIRNSHLILAAKEGAFFKSNGDSAKEPYRGPIWMILKYLQEALNFTFELKRPPDGTVGYIYENGSWSGLVGMINRSEVDFGIGTSV